jgi:hypothetical protein
MTTTPKITRCDWGKTELKNGQTYKDVKIWPGGARAWDWNETGTSHQPGIQPADVEELLENGAEYIVLTRGFHKRLHTKAETVHLIKQKGLDYDILETGEAVERINELIDQGEAVGALIHSTC